MRPLTLFAVFALIALLVAACAPASPPVSAPAQPAPTAAPAAKPAEAAKPAALAPQPAASPAAAPAPAARAAPSASSGQAPSASSPSAESAGRTGQADAAKPAAASAPAIPPAAPGAPAIAPAPLPPPGRPPEPGQASQPQALPAVTLPNRMIIYSTDLTLLVKEVQSVVVTLGEIAFRNGGYVAGVENTTESGLPLAIVRLRLLPERYGTAMNEIRREAVEVRNEKASTQDVTEEYSDVQTQLASLEAAHRQLLDLMARATSMDEVLKIQQQAAQVKLQIDRLRGRATVLERLSELATITVRVQPAEAVLGKDYVAVRTQLRQAQSQQAAQLLALKRAKTPEEEAKIRDSLAELALQIDRSTVRLNELGEKARQAGVTLPTQAPEEGTQAGPVQDLPGQFIATRIKLRQAEARQIEVTRRLKLSLPPEDQAALRQELTGLILEISNLNTQLRTIQERASQLGVTLPTLTAEQEAALSGTIFETPAADPLRAIVAAWEASLGFLRAALAAVLGALVFVWWLVPLLALLLIGLARTGRLPGFGRRRVSAPAAPAAEASE